jgi:hypothetical protein
LIIDGLPPNFEQIRAAFPDAAKPGVVFAYGSSIYAPGAKTLPEAIRRHESVHQHRQLRAGMTPELWWESYLLDHEFRYYEELKAHAVEYIAQLHPLITRNDRARLLNRTAQRLIAPLYNYTPPRTLPQALRDLTKEISR